MLCDVGGNYQLDRRSAASAVRVDESVARHAVVAELQQRIFVDDVRCVGGFRSGYRLRAYGAAFYQETCGGGNEEVEEVFEGEIAGVLAALGIVLGVVVAVYTGVLLMSAPGVPLWNTLLLPCLFAVSALDTGVALVEIIAVTVERKQVGPRKASKAHRLLKRFVVVLVLVELVVLFVFLNTMLSGSSDNAAVAATGALSADLLMWGTLAPFFWGLVVACGLVLPLVAAIVGLAARSKSSDSLAVVGASGALLGGCALRFLVLMAGLHADVVANAVATLIH